MRIQISSGQGPAECELAVALFYHALQIEIPDLALISSVPGKKKQGFQSVICKSDTDVSSLEGSILWICQSPYRPEHKRKNWYIDVSLLTEQAEITTNGEVRFETFRCGGKGGQHVNKVETGVRIIHIPTGISVVSTQARSQHMNKQLAWNRLLEILAQMEWQQEQKEKQLAWMEHSRLERGNPIRIYEGMGFNPKK